MSFYVWHHCTKVKRVQYVIELLLLLMMHSENQRNEANTCVSHGLPLSAY